jgi:hypothetical protein
LRKESPFVTKLVASSLALELPGDLDAITIHPTIPGLGFSNTTLGQVSRSWQLPRRSKGEALGDARGQ